MADFYETCLSADFVLLEIEENAKVVTKVIEIFSCLPIVFYVAIVGNHSHPKYQLMLSILVAR